MSHRLFSANKLARSLFFIVFVGGLLFCISYTLSYIANHYLYNNLRLDREVSVLEVSGLVAFIYVLAFGFKFGFSSRKEAWGKINLAQYDFQHEKMDLDANTEDCDDLTAKYRQSLSDLSEAEKEELKRKLADICGIDPSEAEQSHF